MTTGPPFDLPYPVDYDDPSDTPKAVQALAEATDDGLRTRADAGHDHPQYPRVYISATAPANPRVGDIWVPT